MMLLFPMFTDVLPPMPEKDVDVSRRLIKMIVDFAEHGKLDWQPLANVFTDDGASDNGTVEYLEIGEEFLARQAPLPNQVRTQLSDIWFLYA